MCFVTSDNKDIISHYLKKENENNGWQIISSKKILCRTEAFPFRYGKIILSVKKWPCSKIYIFSGSGHSFLAFSLLNLHDSIFYSYLCQLLLKFKAGYLQFCWNVLIYGLRLCQRFATNIKRILGRPQIWPGAVSLTRINLEPIVDN